MTKTVAETQQFMRDSLPRYYDESRIAGNIIDQEADELARISASAYDVLDQFYIGSATWGLIRWEKIFGITTDPTKTYEQRREVLRGKLRGVGRVNAELIENVAAAYANGEVDVTPNIASYTLTITFVGVFGVPAQIYLLKETLREIIPAHLAIDYVFRFFTYAELTALNQTYGEIAATGKTYDDIYNRRF
ncbi:putative phage tail protein [Paenibacillus polymyxa]|uniref:putative phage tail protein n=1 Tax=Paenibacillus polymyxa TaxID=1406 RepID=UPI000ACC54C6|nr:putative phage tail protein [Paenibacillus polymyxa]